MKSRPLKVDCWWRRPIRARERFRGVACVSTRPTWPTIRYRRSFLEQQYQQLIRLGLRSSRLLDDLFIIHVLSPHRPAVLRPNGNDGTATSERKTKQFAFSLIFIVPVRVFEADVESLFVDHWFRYRHNQVRSPWHILTTDSIATTSSPRNLNQIAHIFIKYIGMHKNNSMNPCVMTTVQVLQQWLHLYHPKRTGNFLGREL